MPRVLDQGETQPGLTGTFQRYQQAIAEQQVDRMLEGQSAFSRRGPLPAWVVIWLMIFQRLQAKGTLTVAVRQLLTGPVQVHLRWPDGKTGPPVGQHQCLQSSPQPAAVGGGGTGE